MTREVRWPWIGGKRCPYCGGAVLKYTEDREDKHTVSGFANVQSAILMTQDKPIGAEDKAFDVPVGTKGHREITKTVYRHEWGACCETCGKAIALADLEDGEPKSYPVGYWAGQDAMLQDMRRLYREGGDSTRRKVERIMKRMGLWKGGKDDDVEKLDGDMR